MFGVQKGESLIRCALRGRGLTRCCGHGVLHTVNCRVIRKLYKKQTTVQEAQPFEMTVQVGAYCGPSIEVVISRRSVPPLT
jgi:hypothetical protein